LEIELKKRMFYPTELTWNSEVDLRAACGLLRQNFESSATNEACKMLFQMHGMIESSSGKPVRIAGRWLPRWPSILEARIEQYWKRLPDDSFQIYYNHPKSCPGFNVLAYACSGRRTSLATLRAGLTMLEEIAILAGDRAIVCQSTNPRLSRRILEHFGFVQHATHLKGRHYIKRLESDFVDQSTL